LVELLSDHVKSRLFEGLEGVGDLFCVFLGAVEDGVSEGEGLGDSLGVLQVLLALGEVGDEGVVGDGDEDLFGRVGREEGVDVLSAEWSFDAVWEGEGEEGGKMKDSCGPLRSTTAQPQKSE